MSSDPGLSIVHVVTAAGWYGGERQAWLLLEGLRALGHRNVLVARRDGEIGRRAAEAGHAVVPIAGSGRSPRGVGAVREAVRRHEASIIHAHDAHAVLAGGVAGLLLPGVVRIGARRFLGPTSRLKYSRLCDRVVAVSIAVADRVVGCGVPRERVEVVHDGVDPTRATGGDRARGRAALGLGDDAELVLCIASLEPAKGVDVLVEAAAVLASARPRLVVAVAGDGSQREALAGLVARRGLADRVRLLGYRRDVPDLLHGADVVVQPSRSEALGTSIIDAMLAGRAPVVASAVGGVPELLGPDAEGDPVGRLVPSDDPSALATATADLLDDPARSAALAGAARRRAEARFTASRMVEATVAVYRRALRTAGSAPTGDAPTPVTSTAR